MYVETGVNTWDVGQRSTDHGQHRHEITYLCQVELSLGSHGKLSELTSFRRSAESNLMWWTPFTTLSRIYR
jgi:hypothetical protein